MQVYVYAMVWFTTFGILKFILKSTFQRMKELSQVALVHDTFNPYAAGG